jgi:WD40 repeat protein
MSRRDLGGIPHHDPRPVHAALFRPQGRADSVRSKARATHHSGSIRLIWQSGKSVFLRSIDNPAVSKQYTQHTAQTTVARFAPSGFYVASGDVSGAVRVWDCAGEGATKGVYFGPLRPHE